MASSRTRLTELGTAVGLVLEPSARWPDALDHLEVPGIARDVWHPALAEAAARPGAERDLLLRAVDNGRAFRARVLGGRRPERIEWTGSARTTWTSDVPRDLTVDGVWFVQAKFDSTCVLNTSPASLADALLADDGVATRRSWYAAVARAELAAYYDAVRADLAGATLLRPTGDGLPDDVRDLDGGHRRLLKAAMRGVPPSPAQDAAYAELSRAVSIETALRWQHRLRASSSAQRTQMLFRMLRIAGGPYWLLGTKGRRPVRLAVVDTRSWRDRFELRAFEVTAARVGQPQVDWRAVVRTADGDHRAVEGHCEIRWSHGKLQGNPECKVQVDTPLHQLPGYDPLGG
jgi:hypothetical protein